SRAGRRGHPQRRYRFRPVRGGRGASGCGHGGGLEPQAGGGLVPAFWPRPGRGGAGCPRRVGRHPWLDGNFQRNRHGPRRPDARLGVERLLYTDISRDGTLEEPNYAATAALVEDSGLKVLSAGGVGAAEHVAKLVPTGAEAAIIGRALYTGDITIGDALAAARG
ncbi:1-(5-phosphoribosyl)-5-[(5-phosphoribosylamino)methylideneamino] imidazole-4-carboxamide isomerase, partial [Geodia barretti]